MATTDRRARHRASLRREILDAASRVFADEGIERVTMRRVAEQIEYSPTTIYLYFKDKQDLVAAICDETFSQLAARLERLKPDPDAVGPRPAPLDVLRDGLKAYVDFGTSHPHHYTVTFLQRQEIPADFAFEHTIGARAFAFLRESVRACVAAGSLKATDVETTAQALWAGVHGLTALFVTMQGFPFAPRPALTDHLIETLLAGLKPVQSPARPAAARPSARLSFLD